MGAASEADSVEETIDNGGSERLFALTRTEQSPDDMIRFVAAPGGEIVPDLGRKLPGRGVWLKCDRSVVVGAIKTKVFARSLKRPVTVAGDLAERVEHLLQKRALEALSLANKAGLVVAGFAQVEMLIDHGEALALVHGSDAAEGGQEKLDRKFKASCRDLGRDAHTITLFGIEQMSLAMGRANVVHAALKSGGATNRFLREAKRLARYRACSDTAPPARSQFEG